MLQIDPIYNKRTMSFKRPKVAIGEDGLTIGKSYEEIRIKHERRVAPQVKARMDAAIKAMNDRKAKGINISFQPMKVTDIHA